MKNKNTRRMAQCYGYVKDMTTTQDVQQHYQTIGSTTPFNIPSQSTTEIRMMIILQSAKEIEHMRGVIMSPRPLKITFIED